MTNRVFPIGYEQLGARDRVAELLQNKKTLLIDTRITPYSWRADWTDKELRRLYKDKYHPAGKYLGNPAKNTGLLRIANPVVGIQGLVQYLIEGNDLVLLCKCCAFAECHMSLIVEMLVKVRPEVEVIRFKQPVPQPDTIPCISVRPPYGTWLANPQRFMEAGIIPKIYENRDKDFTGGYRGPVLIHQSKTFEQDAIDYWMLHCPNLGDGILGDAFSLEKRDYPLGAIVGIADLVNVVQDADDPWFTGKYGLVLANARPIEPIPYKGQLGLFSVPRSVLEQKEVISNGPA